MPGPAGGAPRPGKQGPRCAWSRATWGARVARAGHGLLGPWRQNISPGTCPISPDLRSRVTDLVITWFADLLGTPAAEGFSLPPPPSPAALSKDPPVRPPSPPSSHCPPHPKIPPARYIPVAFGGPLRQHWQEAAFQPLNLTAPPRLRAMGWAGALTEGTPNVWAAGSLCP